MSISARLRFRIFTRDNFTCQYCGRRSPDVVLNVDHREPVSKGGNDDPANLVTACVDCNQGKSNERITVACPAVCFKCLDEGRENVFYCAAQDSDLFETDEGLRYIAHYVCDFGHRWFLSFDASARWTMRDIEDQVAQSPGWRLRA